MILATDVDYREDLAVAAGVIFENWSSEKAFTTKTVNVTEFGDYVPGQFYKRELPCISALLEAIETPISCIVVDGFVTLGADKRPGLGYHLWEKLERKTPIIGVAKNSFQNTRSESEVFRGISKKPLYVTAVGLDLSDAINGIESMHGEHRLPTMLKLVDSVCRQRTPNLTAG